MANKLTDAGSLHDDSWDDWRSDNRSVLGLLFCLIVMIAVLYFLDRRWLRKQQQLAKATGIMNESHAYALNLVRHFMPSYKVEKYQFRGLEPKTSTMSIGFENLSLQLHSGVNVLKGVTGEFEAGRMCAIMGPSGAGKTTFMNVLCGKATYGQMGGTIRINGDAANIQDVKSILGFVPQDDIVHEDLTVREQIQFSAKLRNKKGIEKIRIKLITDDVLNVMQIDHIQNSIVGGVTKRGISGGQRKRVNIGLELAAQPTVLFLDEPTSGLDSTSSYSVALSLKKMGSLGMTSIMVIHQPRYSLFTLFDDVLLLGKGGQTVYLGPSVGAKKYFESHGFEMPKDENPADWFMDVISGEVDNKSMKDFKPTMLFELWSSGRNRPTKAEATETRLSEDDDIMLLRHALEEQWMQFDENRDGFLQEDELKGLLMLCSGIKPCDAVVRELFTRMGGKDHAVTKEQFLMYLRDLSSSVATDHALMDAIDAERKKMAPSYLTNLVRLGAMSGGGSDSFSSSSEETELEKQESGGWTAVSSGTRHSELFRRTPGFRAQLHILVRRRLVQWWRKNDQRMLFLAALSVGAVVLGVMDRFILETPRWEAMAFLNTHTALALLIAIFCLQVFGDDQPVFWRESSTGLNTKAFFLSRIWINTFDLVIQTFLFTAVYFLIRQPHCKFWRYMIPNLLVTFASSGWGYVISCWVPPANGPFITSLVAFVVCGLMGNPQNLGQFLNGGVLEISASAFSITRWSVAMSFNYQVRVEKPNPPPQSQLAGMLAMEEDVFSRGMISDLGVYWTCTLALVSMGWVLRAVAFVGLCLMNRDKRV